MVSASLFFSPCGSKTSREGRERATPLTRMAVLVLTGLEDEERTRYSQLHARVQAGLADLGISQVCVTSTPVRRTLKLLTALAHGAWVVGEEYLQACARSRSTLDPTSFELVSQIPGCRAARLGGCGSALQRSRQAWPRS